MAFAFPSMNLFAICDKLYIVNEKSAISAPKRPLFLDLTIFYINFPDKII